MNLYRPFGGVVEAVQWLGSNEPEVREILGDDRPLPRVGSFVVRRAGGIAIYNSEDFAANYEPVFSL